MNKTIITSLLTCTILATATPATAQILADTDDAPIKTMTDNAFIVLTGFVGETRYDEFDLNYDDKKITVELDRFGWGGDEAEYLVPGESVTVSGYIDDDLFEGREIEAYNIRLNDSNVYYYTSEDDPTYYYTYDVDYTLEDGTYVSMKGEVENIIGYEFTLTNNDSSMRVDVSELGYNPFDDDGYLKIESGDEVYVYGDIDSDFFDAKEIMADGSHRAYFTIIEK